MLGLIPILLNISYSKTYESSMGTKLSIGIDLNVVSCSATISACEKGAFCLQLLVYEYYLRKILPDRIQ